MLGGVLVSKFHFIGGWLLLSAFGLLILEQLIYDKQLNDMLDQYDGIIDAKVAADNADFFSGQGEAPSIDQASGISVIMAPELTAMIAKRRAEKAAKNRP